MIGSVDRSLRMKRRLRMVDEGLMVRGGVVARVEARMVVVDARLAGHNDDGRRIHGDHTATVGSTGVFQLGHAAHAERRQEHRRHQSKLLHRRTLSNLAASLLPSTWDTPRARRSCEELDTSAKRRKLLWAVGTGSESTTVRWRLRRSAEA
jgi:hypothetical protein